MLRVAVVLLIATLLLQWPHAQLQDWTGTEGRRVQIALEMARSGDWLLPTLFGEPTFAKPPLHYWLLAGASRLFGDGFLAMRLPAMLCVFLLSLLAFALHARVFGRAAGWVVALGVLCAPLVLAEFASAEIDPAFACFCAASLWLLAYGVARQHRATLVVAGVVGGLALLDKGPPYLVFAGGAWLVWWRHRRLRGWWFYLAPLLAVPVAYYVPLLLGRVDAHELTQVAGDETVGRLFTYRLDQVLETPLFWLKALAVQLPLLCWCFWEFRSTRDARMGPEDLTLRMCSGAAVGAVLLLSLFPARPTRYLLPNVPLFTFAVAPAAAHYAVRCARIGGVGRGIVRAIGVLGALLLIAVPFAPAPLPARTPVFALLAALLPWGVRSPRHLLAACFLLPAVGAWTLLADRRDAWELGPRARTVHGTLLARELAGLAPDGTALRELECFGHVHGGLLLGAGLLPRGHEPAVRQPTARFVLHEDERYPALPPLPGYTERLRLCIPGETFVVEERERSGR